MIRHGQKGYFAGGRVVGQGTAEVKAYWSTRERKLSLNGQPVRKLTDYLGTLRAVVFCTEDLFLVKGTARVRRRFLDLLLSQTQPAYLPLLQRYMKTVRARNALLKKRTLDPVLLESFTRDLVTTGNQLMQFRRDLLPRISPLARLAYRRIAGGQEELRIEYAPAVKQDFATELARVRARELNHRTTVIGPHRDDLSLLVNDQPAGQFASEGQKRSLVIALKMAQAEYLTGIHGAPPVLLIDDVMGELDAKRRSGLLPLLERTHHAQGQVFMTCTERNWPRELERRVTSWQIEDGRLNQTK
jgi:DNA replication and repair protein RecF